MNKYNQRTKSYLVLRRSFGSNNNCQLFFLLGTGLLMEEDLGAIGAERVEL